MIYTRGKGKDYWERWIGEEATAQDRLEWTALIIKTTAKVCARTCV